MARRYFSEEGQQRIINAIKEVELRTSGEIMVHVESRCFESALERGLELFESLRVHSTDARNGVLIYAAFQDRKLAIIADVGINAVVAENFWDQIKSQIVAYFQDDEYVEGLVEGIHMVGDALERYFPYQPGDINELPDEISFGE